MVLRLVSAHRYLVLIAALNLSALAGYCAARLTRSTQIEPAIWVGSAVAMAGVLLSLVIFVAGSLQFRAKLHATEREGAHRKQTAILEILNRIGPRLAAEFNLEKLLQVVTDAATDLTGAQYGAFLHSVATPQGEIYVPHAISGLSRETFLKFFRLRNTRLFAETFRGFRSVRVPDLRLDYRLEHEWSGPTEAPLSVRSYLAVPVASRSGEILGGLFLGHGDPNVFTEQHERVLLGVAAQAAIAIDNARLYKAAQTELAKHEQAETTLRESREQIHRITDALPVLIGHVDAEQRFLFVNRGFEAWFGIPRRNIVGKHIEQILGKAHYNAVRPQIEAALRGEEVRFESRVPHSSGTRYVEGTFVPHRAPDGTVSGLYALVADTTDREHDEEALRQSEERFRLMVDRARDYAIFFLDKDGCISMWNPGAERILGYREAEVIGQPSGIIFTPEDRERGVVEIEMTTALDTGQFVDERWHMRKDGSRFWASDYLIALRDEAGQWRGFAKIMRDITERKKAEEAIQQMTQELEQRVELRTSALQESHAQLESFSYTVAHDLRAPLRAMQGFSEALLEDYGPELDRIGQDYIHRVISAAARMDTLIQDLLAYSRISRTELRAEAVKLEKVVDSVVLQFDQELQNKGATIAIEHPLPTALGHGGTLEQVLTNLISNGLKFVTPGLAPRLRIWGEALSEQVRLWVEDNGIGIAPQHQERIFHVFERLHGTEMYPGTGLGLAIVRKGVDRMNGRLGVESELGRGSRFWIELPKAQGQAEMRSA